MYSFAEFRNRLSPTPAGQPAMTAKQSRSPSAAEWKVMRIVWQLKSCAARDVYQVAGEAHGMAASTVKTMLRRLTEKGCLTTTQVGNCFVYRPSRSQLSILCSAADNLLEQAVDGCAGRVLVHMLKNSKMSADEVAELRAALDEAQPETEKEDDQ